MRNISQSLRNSIQSPNNTELLLIFGTITHESLAEPIRVVTEDVEGVSYANGKPINYVLGGEEYKGCPFSFNVLTDGDQPARAQLSVQNVDHRVGDAILQITTSPTFKFQILKLSDFTEAVNADNQRIPIGTPDIEYNAPLLKLRNITGDVATVTADIVAWQIADEPCPAIRTTQDRTPGLYR